ncbi:prolyl oligopeptidase family serine peptidase [Olivibacter sp. XZL3]|uniref:S9 family peptidase n=1 Tax=Olivibacter sp. XZL3 TaxID=1735116 RepID=UPI001065EF06|nr:prolyl oligopeptidase family serine peptidase [Olivibacter sp. XZL3]
MYLKKAVSIFLFVTCHLFGKSQELTLETLTSYPFPSSLVSAGAGDKIALTINEQGKRNIWVAEGSHFELRKVTDFKEDYGEELSGVTLSADGQWVVYVKGGDHGAFDESEPRNPASLPIKPKVAVWSVPFDGGTPICLGEGDYPLISPDSREVLFEQNGQLWTAPIDGTKKAAPLFFARGKNSSAQFSPDGSKIVFVSDRGDHSLIGVFRDRKTPIQWLAPDFCRDVSPRWSPDGAAVVFVRTAARGGAPDSLTVQKPQPWAIWRSDLANGKGTEIWSSPNTLEGSIPTTQGGFNLHWAAKDRIVFLSYHDGWPHLYSIPSHGGELLPLTVGDFMVEHVQLSRDGQWLLFSANTGENKDDIDRRHVYRVPVDQAQLEALTKGKGIETFPTFIGDGQHLAFFQSTAQKPPTPSIMPFKPHATARVIGEKLIPQSLLNASLVVPKSVSWKSTDGKTVYGQLFEPVGGSEKRAAIVFVHGGPQRQMLSGWHYGDYYANTYALNQYLASKGFIVLAVNYRLGIGYGFDFHKPANAGRFGASEYQDVQSAGTWLAEHPRVDAERIGIYGGSYGGYLTALALGKNSDLFAAGVDIHGVHNYLGRVDLHAAEPAPDAELAIKLAKESSPISWTDNWKSPTLMIHGDDDGNVDFHQSVDLILRLKQKSVPLETMMIPDETHHWMRYENQLRVDQAVADFFLKTLMNTKK